MENETFLRVAQAIEETGGVPCEREEELLKEELGLDSLSLVSVIVRLEEDFGIAFEDDDLDPERLLTAGDLVRLAEKYR